METITTAEIDATERIRGDLGDVKDLAASIKEFGLIQPIVLRKVETPSGDGQSYVEVKLVAGGRRFTAITQVLKWDTLRHGLDFVWREEIGRTDDAVLRMKMQSIEIEENVRRKDLTWQEIVLGKQRIMEIQQKLKGVRPPEGGAPSAYEVATGERKGFGVRSLASMLGESLATTSVDLQLARFMTAVPALGLDKAITKTAALRKLNIVSTVMQMAQKPPVVQPPNADGSIPVVVQAQTWSLYEGDWKANSKNVPDDSVDLIHSDLPYGVDIGDIPKHDSGGTISFVDTRDEIVADLDKLASESYRVLRNDRYATFFFGFVIYEPLFQALERAGFKVDRIPFVWFKDTRHSENPHLKYTKSYEPLLIAWKGTPCLIRPGQQNFVSLTPEAPKDKLHIAQKPVKLAEKFILDMTGEGAVVLDFYAGSGTTGVAALNLKRQPILFERDPFACAAIKGRMARV